MLSHESAAAAWKIRQVRDGPIEVSVLRSASQRTRGVRIHRRFGLTDRDIRIRRGLPLTSPVLTLIDLATQLQSGELESAINEADKRDLVTPTALRLALDEMPRRPGIGLLRALLDHHTFVLTDSELERRFLPHVSAAGLPSPLTRRWVNGYRVDFFWPELGLVVETDGLRYHRTPAQQAKDRRRDQAHARAGLTPLRFTHAQVRFEPEEVRRTLAAVAGRLLRRLAA
jgi:very-short-patch-repair endonuclease